MQSHCSQDRCVSSPFPLLPLSPLAQSHTLLTSASDDSFAKEFPNATFYKLDVDECPDVAQELGVNAMPTFLFFKKGEKVGEVVGANPVALESTIKQYVA